MTLARMWELQQVKDNFPQVVTFAVADTLTRHRGCLRSENIVLLSIHLPSLFTVHLVLVENKLSRLQLFEASRYLGDGVGGEVDQVELLQPKQGHWKARQLVVVQMDLPGGGIGSI